MSEPMIKNTDQPDPIVRATAWLCDLPVERVRTDAVQAFVKQETIFVEVETAAGVRGLGYSYTIGTGGGAVLSLLRQTLLDTMVGTDIHRVEKIWSDAFGITRATTTGPITSLALAALDTAVWDARCRTLGLPLWQLAGGFRDRVPVYDTEGGWLQLPQQELVEQALRSQEIGLPGAKIKIGKPTATEDRLRLTAVREAVGDAMDIMVDANQSLTAAEAIRRSRFLAELDIFWFEEPLPADDVTGHARLSAMTTVPIAVGESLYAPAAFREYLQRQAAGILQVDVARVGGITPWLKVAHLAETYNVKIAPHFLMEIHLPLLCAIPNGLYLEHIPQLRAITTTPIPIQNGQALASNAPGLGIEWDRDAIAALTVDGSGDLR
jgi:L-alanine-DL-glutamate epimerase-like enolase superfamily enzyme